MRLSQGNDMCMFVTMACAVLDGESGELRYASAGHERPLLRRLGGETTVLVLEGGPALGLGADAGFPVWTGHLAPGDTLVLCTDGVTEAFDRAGVAFGLERFRRVVAETPADALGTLPDRLVEAVERFSVGGAPRDDLAMLAAPVPAPRRDGGRARGGIVAILGRQRARDRRPGVAVDRGDPAGPRRSPGDRPRLRARGRGAPDERGHPRLSRPVRAPGPHQAPAPAGEDRDPARGRRARRSIRSRRRRRTSRRRSPLARSGGSASCWSVASSTAGSTRARERPTSSRSTGAARRFPGGRGLRGRDTAWSGRDRRARDRDRQPRTDGALGGAPGAPRHRHRAPARGGARSRARSTGRHVARVPARRPRVHQQRGHPVRHPRAQGDRGARRAGWPSSAHRPPCSRCSRSSRRSPPTRSSPARRSSTPPSTPSSAGRAGRADHPAAGAGSTR